MNMKIVRNEVRKQVKVKLYGQLTNQVNIQTRVQVYNQLTNQIQIWNQINNEVRFRVKTKVKQNI
jgi:imidazoleglycerol phosphate dehydratase HisB